MNGQISSFSSKVRGIQGGVQEKINQFLGQGSFGGELWLTELRSLGIVISMVGFSGDCFH